MVWQFETVCHLAFSNFQKNRNILKTSQLLVKKCSNTSVQLIQLLGSVFKNHTNNSLSESPYNAYCTQASPLLFTQFCLWFLFSRNKIPLYISQFLFFFRYIHNLWGLSTTISSILTFWLTEFVLVKSALFI